MLASGSTLVLIFHKTVTSLSVRLVPRAQLEPLLQNLINQVGRLMPYMTLRTLPLIMLGAQTTGVCSVNIRI